MGFIHIQFFPLRRFRGECACHAPLSLVATEALNILRRIEALNGYGSQVGHQTNGHRGKSLLRALGAKDASAVRGFTLHGH
jgi:hypothetical protein